MKKLVSSRQSGRNFLTEVLVTEKATLDFLGLFLSCTYLIITLLRLGVETTAEQSVCNS